MKKDIFKIKGLNGKKTLGGEITINGAKNAVLKAMAAALLFKDEVVINNVPQNEDVKKTITLLETMGVSVKKIGERELSIHAGQIINTDLNGEIAQSMRGSVVMTGPILTRYGKVAFPAPGGCVIGARPIDLFIEGYKKMGAEVHLKNDVFHISAPKGLKGTEIIFHIQTVGGTETLMMAAVCAEGITVLKNCAMEPEITSLAEFLVSCGARIKGIGTTTLEITGGGLLESKSKAYETIPDRIEAGSFLLLGALCADNLLLKKCNPLHLEVVLSMLKESGVPLSVTDDTIEIKGNGALANDAFKSFNVRTHEYPGFPTDLQSPLVTFLTQTSGESIIFETIFEGRFKYTQDLIKMGAGITIMNPREIMVKGPCELKALVDEELQAYDIRAGFATVMAALIAKGDSTISNVYYIDRGYENLEGRLRSIGADIERV